MRLKALVAEPDDALRRGLRGFLEHHGHFVESAQNAADAIKLGLRLRPDVLITNGSLADETTGQEAATGLLNQGLELSIIVLTADHAEDVSASWRGFPLIEYFTIPLSFTRLLAVIEADRNPIVHDEENHYG